MHANIKFIQNVAFRTLGFPAYPDKGPKNIKIKTKLFIYWHRLQGGEKKSALCNYFQPLYNVPAILLI